MNEDNERDRLAELAERHQAMMRDIEQIKQILRGNESLVPQIEQILPLMRDAVALRRQIKPIVQAAEQFARGAQWAKTGALALPLPLQLALAVNADLRDLLPAGEPAVHDVTLAATVTETVSMAGVGTLTASGSGALAPMRATGRFTVENRRSGLAALSDGQIVFLVFVWLYALVLPWFGTALPPELHAMLADGYATFAIALAITWRLVDKHK